MFWICLQKYTILETIVFWRTAGTQNDVKAIVNHRSLYKAFRTEY